MLTNQIGAFCGVNKKQILVVPHQDVYHENDTFKSFVIPFQFRNPDYILNYARLYMNGRLLCEHKELHSIFKCGPLKKCHYRIEASVDCKLLYNPEEYAELKNEYNFEVK